MDGWAVGRFEVRQECVKDRRRGAEETLVVSAASLSVTLQSRDMRRAFVIFASVLGVISMPVLDAPASAQTPIGSVIVDGTGNGHGRGMSQWGAYGWAVDQGKDWQWILDWYYDKTENGNVGSSATIDVQLKALDGTGTLGVVSTVGARRGSFEKP